MIATQERVIGKYSDWRALLEKTRETNQKGLPGKLDLRHFWREKAFRDHDGAPAPVVWAHAFANVLDNIALQAYPGELITGSRRNFGAVELPAGLSEAQFNADKEAQIKRGRRGFGSGWDHTLADYPTLLTKGVGGILEDIAAAGTAQTTADAAATLEGMRIVMEAFGRFIQRHSAICRDDVELSGSLEWIASKPPRTFREAVQLVWLTHLVFVTEGRYANALGRVDQYLFPFFANDIANGSLDEKGALAILCSAWAHIEELGEVTNICVGGLRPDGEDGTNDLSYLCIEATRLVQSPHTNLSARFHDNTPEAFHRACFECIKTGIGFPAIFNDHVLIPGLLEIGIPEDVARDHCMVGCIETMLAGRQQAWSDSRFNTPVGVLRALRRLNSEGGEPNWKRLCELVEEELRKDMAKHVDEINAGISRFPPSKYPDPFLSVLTRDCIARAKDINDGGAEFRRFHGACVMGLATVSDSLAAVKKLVIEEKAIKLSDLIEALDANFEGAEAMRQTLINKAPKYGNADPYVDDIAVWIVKMTSSLCLDYMTVDGGRFVSAMAANTNNIYAGREVGATPDGRKALEPLSDAASPFFGRDLHGPTAFLRSVAQPDYRMVLTGSVINMKFEPEFFEGEEGAQRFSAFTHFFVQNRIPELQFNFTGNKTLIEARKTPENFANLVVRVSGFSAYFTRLAPEVQDDIIRRRSHGQS